MAQCLRQYICSCFYTHNIFLQQYGMHVIFYDRNQFIRDYTRDLALKGCHSGEQIDEVVTQIRKEIDRRKQLGQHHIDRRQIIAEKYNPLHPHVYKLQDSFLSPEFLDLVSYCNNKDATKEGLLLLQCVEQKKAPGVFSFPVFTTAFCNDLIEELVHFESSDLPKGRPNTMNNYGILLDELGFDDDFLTPFREKYLSPITKLLYPEWGGDSLDSHKAFIVAYKIGEDLSLSYHYDNAEVTLNVSLGLQFTEGSLYFGDMRTVPVDKTVCTECTHVPTHGVLHRGQHMHGALPIQEGERYNLIIWMRSARIRNELCPMCNRKPRLVETIGPGDGFTKEKQQTVEVCNTS